MDLGTGNTTKHNCRVVTVANHYTHSNWLGAQKEKKLHKVNESMHLNAFVCVGLFTPVRLTQSLDNQSGFIILPEPTYGLTA